MGLPCLISRQRWMSCVTSWLLPHIRTRWFQNCPRVTVRHHQASIFITSHDASFIEKVSTRVVVIQEGRLYRDGTFEEIFGNVHQHEVYHLLLDKSAESVLRQRFPEMDYKVLDGGISVETRNPDLYRLLLEETEVLQFTREPASLEDLLYEVLK